MDHREGDSDVPSIGARHRSPSLDTWDLLGRRATCQPVHASNDPAMNCLRVVLVNSHEQTGSILASAEGAWFCASDFGVFPSAETSGNCFVCGPDDTGMAQEGRKSGRGFCGWSEEVIRALIEVHRHLGPGSWNLRYEARVCAELAERGSRLTTPKSFRSSVLLVHYK
jgi:hypothetical protein